LSSTLSTRRIRPGNSSSVVWSGLGLLEIGQALLKASNVGRIVGEGVIREADPAGKIRFEEFCDRFLRKTEIGEAFAVCLADELVSALHRALALLEALDLIDQLGDAPVIMFGLVVVLLRLGKVVVDALKVSAVAFLGMMTHQNWLTESPVRR
jgi:hypothetical protein